MDGVSDSPSRRRFVRHGCRTIDQRAKRGMLPLVCAIGLFAIFAGTAAGDPSSDAEAARQIAQLIRGLEDDSFGVREASQRALLRMGREVLVPLKKAATGGSPELRRRARVILDRLHYGQHGHLTLGFARLAAQEDGKVDLEEGMLLIAQIVDPAATASDLSGPLDELAAAVQKRLGPVPASKSDPRLVMEAIRVELFVEQGFRGNRENYQHPDNSSVARVLATRKGLPILLSHVVVSVGRRLDVPIVGLGIPGVYMAKYDGARAPGNFAKDDIFVNAFEGRLMTLAELREAHGELSVETLKASPRKRTLVRMLTNLSSHFDVVGDPRLAAQVRMYQGQIEASDRTAADPTQ